MKKEFEGSPGPWVYGRTEYYELIVSDDEGGDVCEVWEWDDDKEAGKANAHLIAAAPELLEALQDCQIWLDATYRALKDNHIEGNYEPLKDVSDKAEAVIKKALGE